MAPSRSTFGKRSRFSSLLLCAASLCLLRSQWLTFVSGTGKAQARELRMGRKASSAELPSLLTTLDFALSSKCKDEEVESVAKQLSENPASIGEIWSAAGLTEEQFIGQREFAKAGKEVGIQGSDQAMQAAFSVVANGAGYCEKYKFEDEAKSWGGSAFNGGAFQGSFLRARAWIAFGYAWLYGMSTFCGAFFFGRPIIFSLFNVDIFPSIRQWWI
mmetsp:Transcript_24842/g.45598  ORF Transcript_24842/g.45598 Transcript_24842/m.45598 type:complete len:216 (+) Transcript_24842:63-710(+)